MNDSTTVTQASRPSVTLRPAVDADVDAIAAIWHRGWPDGHLGHVPEALVRHRRYRDLRALVPERVATTTVAETAAGVVGFVTVHDDEVEQVYVDATARGQGVADALLGHAEADIGGHHDRAWLAVVAGNGRARRLYERRGWTDTGAHDYRAALPDGSTLAVPVRRYERRLDRSEGGRGSRQA
jgi:ribosomal protein S18 acetylase RimI-like enzyme